MRNRTDRRDQPGEGNEQVKLSQVEFGADVIQYLIPERHPMLMVDRITSYSSSRLSAQRFVSANDLVFVGHFPDLKLWPGVHTIEGLRQCCAILRVLRHVEAAGMLGGLLELEKRQTLRPHVDESLCRLAREFLMDVEHVAPSRSVNRQPETLNSLDSAPLIEEFHPLRIRVKLLAPIFAGCVIEYEVQQEKEHRAKTIDGVESSATQFRSAAPFRVRAHVDGRCVAKGEVSMAG